MPTYLLRMRYFVMTDLNSRTKETPSLVQNFQMPNPTENFEMTNGTKNKENNQDLLLKKDYKSPLNKLCNWCHFHVINNSLMLFASCSLTHAELHFFVSLMILKKHKIICFM